MHIDLEFLEARIKSCKTVDDCYVVWSEIQDYLGTYDVTEETYEILFNKVKDKYVEITGHDFTVYVNAAKGVM